MLFQHVACYLQGHWRYDVRHVKRMCESLPWVKLEFCVLQCCHSIYKPTALICTSTNNVWVNMAAEQRIASPTLREHIHKISNEISCRSHLCRFRAASMQAVALDQLETRGPACPPAAAHQASCLYEVPQRICCSLSSPTSSAFP